MHWLITFLYLLRPGRRGTGNTVTDHTNSTITLRTPLRTQDKDQAAGGARCAAGRRIEKLRKTIIKKAPLRVKIRKREEGGMGGGVQGGKARGVHVHGPPRAKGPGKGGGRPDARMKKYIFIHSYIGTTSPDEFQVNLETSHSRCFTD